MRTNFVAYETFRKNLGLAFPIANDELDIPATGASVCEQWSLHDVLRFAVRVHDPDVRMAAVRVTVLVDVAQFHLQDK